MTSSHSAMPPPLPLYSNTSGAPPAPPPLPKPSLLPTNAKPASFQLPSFVMMTVSGFKFECARRASECRNWIASAR